MSKSKQVIKKTERKQKIKKSHIFISVLAIVIGIISLIGTSYAIFQVARTSERKSVLNTGSFQIDFTTGEVITLNNMGPMSTADGMNTNSFQFTITNSGTMDSIYKIYLEENKTDSNHPLSTVPNTDYLMISYKTDNGKYSEPVAIKNLYNSNTLVLNKQLKAGESITYEMKIWLNKEAGNDYQNTMYSARIAVESSQNIFDIITDTFTQDSATLEATTDDMLLDYKIYGNTSNENNYLGEQTSDGKYKIDITTSRIKNQNEVADRYAIYLNEPLKKYDEEHIDYIDFNNLQVVYYTKVENNTVVPLEQPKTEKINLPYIHTYTEGTMIKVNASVEPSKMVFKYFKDE